MTEWRAVPNHEAYEVSDDGQVRHGSRVLRPWGPPYRYPTVTIARKSYTIHRLMAAIFIGPAEPGQEVRHLNDNHLDNRLENLAYGTHADNMRDRLANGNDPNRRKTHCRNGHPYDGANTKVYVKPSGRTVRECLTCTRTTSREWHRKATARRRGEA